MNVNESRESEPGDKGVRQMGMKRDEYGNIVGLCAKPETISRLNEFTVKAILAEVLDKLDVLEENQRELACAVSAVSSHIGAKGDW